MCLQNKLVNFLFELFLTVCFRCMYSADTFADEGVRRLENEIFSEILPIHPLFILLYRLFKVKKRYLKLQILIRLLDLLHHPAVLFNHLK